jgi:hypothetical protein
MRIIIRKILMPKKNRKIFAATLAFVCALFLLICPAALAQTPTATVVITRTPYLTLVDIPASFSFGSLSVSKDAHDLFSNANGQLPAETNTISVQDTRNEGGFTLQAQAGVFVSAQNPTDTISSSNLRIVSSSELDAAPGGDLLGNVYYLTGYAGSPTTGETENIATSVSATGTAFGDVATFDAVSGNSLDGPVEIFSGCLSGSQGRVGTMATGFAFTLHIPAYTPAGEYSTTVTYTIIDNTSSSCP